MYIITEYATKMFLGSLVVEEDAGDAEVVAVAA